MKRKLFLIGFIFTSLLDNAVAQAYQPIQFGNTRWMYQESFFSNLKSYCYFSMDTNGYYFNGNKYWRIEQLKAPNYSVTTNGIYIFDDTILHKVFSIDTLTNQIQVLYDFSVSTGDTIKGNANLNPYIFVVTDTVLVDSVNYKIINSINRKHVYIRSLKTGQGMYITWIEGIGSDYDFLNPSVGPTDPVFQLKCHEFNSTIHYGDSMVCANFLTNISKEEDMNPIEIYPNPAANNLVIHIKGNTSELSIIVSDLIGNKLISKETESDSFIITDISCLQKGMYLLTIFDIENSKKYIKSFIKE